MTVRLPKFHLRIDFDVDAQLGPGKADLLQAIRDTGSISAAGRQLRMSYRRAWQLVEALNAMFGVALIETLAGGKGGGGAQLTETGEAVLARYRRVQAACARAIAADVAALQKLRTKP